jgi:type I restriction enzyme S subunit
MEGQELPVGWVEVPLLALGQLIRGVTYSKKDVADSHFPESIPVLRANNIQDRHFVLANLVHVPSILVSEDQIVKVGDVVIATSSGSISVVGKAAQARTSLGMAFGAFCGLIRPSSEISVEYFGHFFSSEYYRTAVSDMARGVNINNLKKSHFESLSIPLPPLNEQRRIAAKLDTTLAAVEACRKRLDGVAAILKRFRQAVLAAATSGELTREWREERGIDIDTWRGYEFSDTVSESRTGLVRSAAEQHELQPGLVPYLKMDSIGESWGCSHEGLKGVQCEDAERRAYELAYGDWLFNTRNSLELVGKSCVWEGPEGVVFNNNILRVRFTSKIRPQWVEICFRSPSGRDMLAGVKSATTSVAAIYQRSLMALEIQVPSLDEQSELIDRVETFFTLSGQLEARLTAARKVVDRLTPALLAKAFRGELVPQDPNDEPASVLLERIRAARQAGAGAGKSSRRGRPKAAANPEQINRNAAPDRSEPLPPDLLAQLLRECGALSERALLAASELDPASFQAQLTHERSLGAIGNVVDDGQELLEAVG